MPLQAVRCRGPLPGGRSKRCGAAVGLGISLVPKSLQSLQLPGIRYVELSRAHMTDLAIAYRKSESSAAVRAFVAHHRARYPLADFR